MMMKVDQERGVVEGRLLERELRDEVAEEMKPLQRENI
jgi:hypothetical protein